MRLLLLATFCLALTFAAEVTFGSVVYGDDKLVYWETKERPDPAKVLAYASWEPSLNETGWHNFHVFSSPDHTDFLQMKAAGYLEGRLMFDQIFMHRKNVNHWGNTNYGRINDPAVVSFFQENLKFVRDNVATYASTSSYWAHVALTMAQFDGFVEGYQAAAPEGHEYYLSELDLWSYQGAGDLFDLLAYLAPLEKIERDTLFEHCSGLVRITEDFNNLYVSHVSWFMYGALNKVLKTYNFHLTTTGTVRNRQSFTSYPGFLFSFDDFYVLEGGLAVFETTISFNNQSLFDYITPQSNLDWLRVTVANRMAVDGKQWVEIFEKYNSGTYNNMWVVVDYNKFVPGYPPQQGIVTILEQLPGYTFTNDNTTTLTSQLYIPSYNTPSLLEARRMAMTKSDGLWEDFDHAGRGKTFRKKAPNVFDLEEMKQLMRYVNRKDHHDFNAFAVASRYDLRKDTEKQRAYGALDAKIVDQRGIKNLWFHAVAGPSSVNDFPRFSFSEWKKQHPQTVYDVPYMGLADEQHYEWLQFGPIYQCFGLTQQDCFEHNECGWCGDKCIAGDSMGPMEECQSVYQYASKAQLYLLLSIVATLMISLIIGCWCYGCAEKVEYNRKLFHSLTGIN
ncbi:hypothetical protein RCL1_008611 [Eukaryota sp. TZLM3-RCL]